MRRLRWYAFRFAVKQARFWQRIATWLIIDRSPLTPEQIRYGQELAKQLKREIKS